MKNKLSVFVAFCAFSLANQPLPAEGLPSPRFGQDNALIDLSAGLINAAVARDVDQTDKVRDVVLGNPVFGTARTRGKVGALLVPDAGNGVVDVMIRGMVVSDTVAVPPDKGLLIYSRTTLPFIARTRLYVNQNGIHSYPTQARASASTKLIKITTLQGQTDTPSTNIAEAVFEATQDLSERMAIDKAQKQLSQSVDEQLRPQIARGNAAFAQGLKQIKDLGVPLRSYHFSSTSSRLTLGAILSMTAQEPPLAPPPQLVLPFDLAGRVHQTAVDDTAQAVLAGKTFSVEDLSNLPGTSKTGVRGQESGVRSQGSGVRDEKSASAEARLVQHYLGALPQNLGVKVVTITFADRDPITVVFADHCLALTIRLKEIRTAGLPLPGVTIRTVYRIENAPGHVDLVRQGPVRIEPFHHAGIGKLSVGTLSPGGLDQMFKSRIPVPDLHPPAELSQIGTLVPAHGDAVNGWLTLTWIRQKS